VKAGLAAAAGGDPAGAARHVLRSLTEVGGGGPRVAPGAGGQARGGATLGHQSGRTETTERTTPSLQVLTIWLVRWPTTSTRVPGLSVDGSASNSR
jgi:hypothetical protein